MSEPRGRRYQDVEFEVADLPGLELQEMVVYTEREDEAAAVLLLKPASLPWQRYFVDAGVGFWEEWDESDAVADFGPPFRRVDIGRRFGVHGAKIESARCESAAVQDHRVAARFVLDLSGGRIEATTLADDRLRISFAPVST